MSTSETASPVARARAANIRDAALTLFDERGYHGTRMQDIADLLGMQAPSLYNHLSSKQDLLREVMLERMQILLDEHALALASADDVAGQLRRAMEAHVRHCYRYRREARIGSREVHSLEEPARTRLLDLRLEFGNAWIDLLERGVAEGRFDVATPQLTAYSLLQMGLGVALWIRPPALSESELVYTMGEMALRVAGADRPPG